MTVFPKEVGLPVLLSLQIVVQLLQARVPDMPSLVVCVSTQ